MLEDRDESDEDCRVRRREQRVEESLRGLGEIVLYDGRWGGVQGQESEAEYEGRVRIWRQLAVQQQ